MGQGHWEWRPRESWSTWALPGVVILAPRPGPTQQPVGSSAGMPQAKPPAMGENTAPIISRQAVKVVLSSQPPLNTPLDMVLPTKQTRPSSTHQGVGTSPSHQEACTSPGPTSPTKRQKTPEARGTMILLPEERKPQTQKVIQNKMAENYVLDEGTR